MPTLINGSLSVIMVVSVGLASHYREGLMELVVTNRQTGNAWVSLPAELPMVDGFAAVADCNRLGDTILVRPMGSQGWHEFLIVDCADPRDGTEEWMEINDVELEVGYPVALQWGSVGKLVEVEIGIRQRRLGGLFP